MPSPPNAGARGRRLLPVALLALALTAGGCSGSDDPAGDAAERPGRAELVRSKTLEVEPVTSLGEVTGPLPRREARMVEKRVSRVAVAWVRTAYLDGSYPREGFARAFAGFSRGARTAARSDLRVLSNAGIGPRTRGVTPTRVEVEVDVLAVDRRAVGATARVLTTFRTEGRGPGRHRVAGRLLLTRDDGRWRVFGYDVSRGEG